MTRPNAPLHFPNDGEDFSAMRAVERWCERNGYSIGRTQRGSPIGVLKGDYDIQKWRNLSKQQRADLDGVITWKDGTPRDGTAVLTLKVK
jgi:hypothetical protein